MIAQHSTRILEQIKNTPCSSCCCCCCCCCSARCCCRCCASKACCCCRYCSCCCSCCCWSVQALCWCEVMATCALLALSCLAASAAKPPPPCHVTVLELGNDCTRIVCAGVVPEIAGVCGGFADDGGRAIEGILPNYGYPSLCGCQILYRSSDVSQWMPHSSSVTDQTPWCQNDSVDQIIPLYR